MLAMGRALMARPKVLLMDEPSMGLSPILVDKVFEVVADIHRQGTTILLVEQNASRALQLASRGYVMDSGEVTMSDAASCSPTPACALPTSANRARARAARSAANAAMTAGLSSSSPPSPIAATPTGSPARSSSAASPRARRSRHRQLVRLAGRGAERGRVPHRLQGRRRRLRRARRGDPRAAPVDLPVIDAVAVERAHAPYADWVTANSGAGADL